MYIIGVTGPIGHGKTTLASLLSSVEPSCEQIESSTLIAEVANAWLNQTEKLPSKNDTKAINEWIALLPPIIQQRLRVECRNEHLQFTEDHFNTQPEHYAKLIQFLAMAEDSPALANTEIQADNKEQYRPLLQWLGSYLLEHADDCIWYKEIVRRIKASTTSTVLYVVGGLRYPADGAAITNAGGVIVKIYRPQIDETDLNDPTERERHRIQADVEIVNNGSLDELLAVAQELYRDLVNDTLKPKYTAHSTAVN